jgi:hypothetical protein
MGKNGFIPTVRVIACNQNCSVFCRLSACGVKAPTQLGCRNSRKCKLALLLFLAWQSAEKLAIGIRARLQAGPISREDETGFSCCGTPFATEISFSNC